MVDAEQRPRAALLALQPEVITPEEVHLVERCLIGRSANCDVVINQRLNEISRIHAYVEWQAPAYVLVDKSANGTFVNGKRLYEPRVLLHEDRISMASSGAMLQYIDLDATTIVQPTLWFNGAEQEFYYQQKLLPLSPNQRRLLQHLFQHKGTICSNDSCIEAIWGKEIHGFDRKDQLYTEINELRGCFKRIDPASDPNKIIETKRSRGYRLILDSE